MFEFLKSSESTAVANTDVEAPAPAALVPAAKAAVADAPVVGEAPSRAAPAIGLALGGGAARGFAHVGVLRTLLKRGFKPDVIAGTSIGAVVAGSYAAGKLDEFEEWARGLTRRRVFGYIDFSLAGAGLIGGMRLTERLQQSVGDLRIEDLPLRLAAIATEIYTGHEIWLTKGRLVNAMRASFALPGVFSPVKVGGRWLMDGALVNPVPVSAARALGARMVIAVNLNADLIGRGVTISSHGTDDGDDGTTAPSTGGRFGLDVIKRQFFGTPGQPGFSTVMMEAFNIMQDRITRARLAGDPPDQQINPRLGAIGLLDFHRASEAIALGAEATERALDSIGEVLTALAR